MIFLQTLAISNEFEISSRSALNYILKTTLKEFQNQAINAEAKVKGMKVIP